MADWFTCTCMYHLMNYSVFACFCFIIITLVLGAETKFVCTVSCLYISTCFLFFFFFFSNVI